MNYSDKLFSYDNLFSNGQLKLPVAEIYQVSELSVIRGGEVNSHKQWCDEITYAISGSARFYENDNSTTVSAGQIHFIKKGNFHKIEVLPDEDFRYICIGFDPDYNADIIKNFYEPIGVRQYFTLADNGTVKHLSEYLIREFYNSDKYSYDTINSYLTLILTSIIRTMDDKAFDFREKHGRTANHAMYKLIRYLDREYIHIDNIKSVAEDLCYNEFYISHLFKKKMGISIKEYLLKKKISYATELLVTTQMSIEEISTALNFSCSHSFRRAFKNQTGITPGEYRKQNQMEQN